VSDLAAKTWFADLVVGDSLKIGGVAIELVHKSGVRAKIKVTAQAQDSIAVIRKPPTDLSLQSRNK
jgi:hypothetical protein